MAVDVFTATGTKVFIAPAQAVIPADATAYAGLTWTEITLIEDAGEYGDQSSVVTAAVIGDGRMRKAKGARDAGEASLVVFPKGTDPGQLALVAAEGTYNLYPIKYQLPNRLNAAGTDEINYFMALVTSKRRRVGANDNIVRDTFALAVNSAITVTAPTSGP
jgi:hypothetical protein